MKATFEMPPIKQNVIPWLLGNQFNVDLPNGGLFNLKNQSFHVFYSSRTSPGLHPLTSSHYDPDDLRDFKIADLKPSETYPIGYSITLDYQPDQPLDSYRELARLRDLLTEQEISFTESSLKQNVLKSLRRRLHETSELIERLRD